MLMRAMLNSFRARNRQYTGGVIAALKAGRECPATVGHDLMHRVLQFCFLDQGEIGVVRQMLEIGMPVAVAAFRDIPADNVDMFGVERVSGHCEYCVKLFSDHKSVA